MAGPDGGPIFESRSFPSKEVEEKFGKRLRLLENAIENRDHFHLHSIMQGDRTSCEIYLSQFSAWTVSEMNWDLPRELVALANKATPQADKPQGAAYTAPPPKREAQEKAILQELQTLGYDPLRLPNERPGANKAVWTKLRTSTQLFQSEGTFEKAWERLASDDSSTAQDFSGSRRPASARTAFLPADP